MPATQIIAGHSASLSLTLAWSDTSAVASASGMTQANTSQPPMLLALDYPHDPHIGPVDQVTAIVLALAVTGITVRERFRFERSIEAARDPPASAT